MTRDWTGDVGYCVAVLLRRARENELMRDGESVVNYQKTYTGVRTNAVHKRMSLAHFICEMEDDPRFNRRTTFRLLLHQSLFDMLPTIPPREADLFSYQGDKYGRGAGIYDVTHDMFFPYDRREEWEDMAATVRRLRGPCVAPTGTALTHLWRSFPHDIYGDVLHISPIGMSWREGFAFECIGHRVHLPGFAQRFDAEAVSYGDMQPRLRHHVPGTSLHDYVEDAGRFFLVDRGRTWRDFDPFHCCFPSLGPHDLFLLLALLGRLFYNDPLELTLLVQGPGRHTVLALQSQFWPFWCTEHLDVPEWTRTLHARIYIGNPRHLAQAEWLASFGHGCTSRPVVCAPHLWVGDYPAHFDNRDGVVSRRLAGVHLADLPTTSMSGMGDMQRQQVLAYRQLRAHGNPLDAPERLPKLFHEFHAKTFPETINSS
jgi:hypothetical protein